MKQFISCGFLIQSKDKFLLCHPSSRRVGKLAGDKGWGLPKGKLDDESESLLDCAIRETKEETNIDLTRYPSVKLSKEPIYETSYLTKYQGERIGKTVHIFHAYDKDGILLNVPLSCPSLIEGTNIPEMDDYRWAKRDEARLMCTRSLRDIFEYLEYYLKKGHTDSVLILRRQSFVQS